MWSAEDDRSGDRPDGDRPTMADVSHANPRTGDTLGDVFRRGPAVADGGAAERDHAADGGAAERDHAAIEAAEGRDADEESMGDVDHTPPNEDVNDVWDRGVESTTDGENPVTPADGGDDV